MAINSSNPAGVTITSWAYNEASAGSQAQANGVDEVVFANDINGTNNGNLVGTPTFTGRCVVKNRGLSDEEVRYMRSQIAGTGTTIIATVSEPWVDAPVSTDTLEVCYIVQDAATVTGVSLVNKTNDDYDFSRELTVLSGGGFFLLNGATLITPGGGSTTVAEIECNSGGWFQVGVEQFSVGVRGGRITLAGGTAPTDGDLGFNFQAGCIANLYSCDVKGVVSYASNFLGDCIIKDSKLFKCFFNGDFTGVVVMENTVIEGTGLATDRITADESTDVRSLVYGAADGFRDDATATTETIIYEDVDWSGLDQYIEVRNANKTHIVLDPFNFDPDTGTQNDLLFTAAGVVDWNNSYEVTVIQNDGALISGSKAYVVESLLTDSVLYEQVTDTNGLVTDNVIYKEYRDNAGTSVTETVYGDWTEKIYLYGYVPVNSALDMTQREVIRQVTLSEDPDQTALNSSDALFSGSELGYLIEPIFHGTGSFSASMPTIDPRPMKLIRVDGETYTSRPSVGDTITQNTTSASGTLIDIVSRGADSADYLVEFWNGAEFTDNTAITCSNPDSNWTGSADTTGFYSEFKWYLGPTGSSATTTTEIIYDYQVARLALTSTLPAQWSSLVAAGDSDYAIPFRGNGSKLFRAEREVDRLNGWWAGRVSDLSNLQYCTADDGTQWFPPNTVTLTITGIVSGTIVSYVDNGTETAIFEETVGLSNESSYTYIYGGVDQDIYINLLDLDLEIRTLENITLSSANQIIPTEQNEDRVYSNPD